MSSVNPFDGETKDREVTGREEGLRVPDWKRGYGCIQMIAIMHLVRGKVEGGELSFQLNGLGVVRSCGIFGGGVIPQVVVLVVVGDLGNPATARVLADSNEGVFVAGTITHVLGASSEPEIVSGVVEAVAVAVVNVGALGCVGDDAVHEDRITGTDGVVALATLDDVPAILLKVSINVVDNSEETGVFPAMKRDGNGHE